MDVISLVFILLDLVVNLVSLVVCFLGGIVCNLVVNWVVDFFWVLRNVVSCCLFLGVRLRFFLIFVLLMSLNILRVLRLFVVIGLVVWLKLVRSVISMVYLVINFCGIGCWILIKSMSFFVLKFDW